MMQIHASRITHHTSSRRIIGALGRIEALGRPCLDPRELAHCRMHLLGDPPRCHVQRVDDRNNARVCKSAEGIIATSPGSFCGIPTAPLAAENMVTDLQFGAL